MKLLLSALIIALLMPPSLNAQHNPMTPATKTLRDLFTSEWNYWMEQYPTWASTLGDRRWNDRWEDRSLDAIAKRHRHNLEVLERLKAIDQQALSASDRLNYKLFFKDCENAIAEHGYQLYLLPLNQLHGVQTADQLADALRFQTIKDYEDWLARLGALPAYIEQTITLMREGMRTGIMFPRVVLERIPAQIEHQTVSDPEASPFYKAFKQFPDGFSKEERSRLAAAAGKAIEDSVIPAFHRFKRFFLREYLPAASARVGIWQWPQGEAAYAFLARLHTTTELTPQAIHELGLKEVARIEANMQTVIDRLGFKGSLQEFAAFLRDDPQFYYKTPEELLAAYRALTRRIDPLLVKLFKTLPRQPYGVEPIPSNVAPDSTTAYYRGPAADGSRAGTYFVNLYKPETRPKHEMMALSLHEAVPGHHLQISLAMEQEDLPNFRRHGSYTAFVEGWGLYAESLGAVIGLYDDPYSKFGQLTYEMWRAVRLVVDTGIHYLQWDRQRAIDYFKQHTARPEADIVNEIDRYIAMPGQALAYKIGQLTIYTIRAKAEEDLGEEFDIRAFHDELLRHGAVPLNVLEEMMDAWIKTQRQ